jgi:hypothetical protein
MKKLIPIVHTIGEITFQFERILTPLDDKFFVIFEGPKHVSGGFEMKRDVFGNWKIVQPAPVSVMAWETELIITLTYKLQVQLAA